MLIGGMVSDFMNESASSQTCYFYLNYKMVEKSVILHQKKACHWSDILLHVFNLLISEHKGGRSTFFLNLLLFEEMFGGFIPI